MARLEFHPGEGGEDAELFARELADSVGKHAGVQPEADGRVMVLQSL